MDWLQNSLITSVYGIDYYQAILSKRSLERPTYSYALDTDYDAMLRAPVMARQRREKKNFHQKTLMNWSEIPEWMRFNPYILTGYRPPSGSYHTCIKSIGEIHNETMNIWTHLFGLVATMLLFIHYLSEDKWSDLAVTPYVPMSVYFICCICCLTCSCIYHTFSSHSHEVAVICNCIDYVSIVLQGTGSWLPSFYYYFYREPKLQLFYTMAMLACGTATAALMIVPRFQAEKYLGMRTAVFLSFGLSGVVALVHSAILHGVSTLFDMGFGYALILGMFYVIGAVFYGARIPERWYPGSFDIWFQSHSIFHMAVVVAVVCYYFSMIQARDYWIGKEATIRARF
ncbi:hemolysin-III related-domain-containing protein [Fennellomyces sp. T-0311]|nr:hemolysin-III related-domain-containing protein [Fennellomyces sp. T-0311]